MKILSRNEMKNLIGGVASPDAPPTGCAVQWYPGHGSGSFDFSNSPNAVTLTVDREAGTYTFTGLTYSQSQSLLGNGGRWCCSSCNTATWLNNPA